MLVPSSRVVGWPNFQDAIVTTGMISHFQATKDSELNLHLHYYQGRITSQNIRSRCTRATLQGINISHLGKRKIIFKMPFLGDMLVPWRVRVLCCFFRNFSNTSTLAILNFNTTKKTSKSSRQFNNPAVLGSVGFGIPTHPPFFFGCKNSVQ